MRSSPIILKKNLYPTRIYEGTWMIAKEIRGKFIGEKINIGMLKKLYDDSKNSKVSNVSLQQNQFSRETRFLLNRHKAKDQNK